MAKEEKTKKEAVAKEPKKIEDVRMYSTNTWTGPSTVFGEIKKAVLSFGEEGVMRSDFVKHFLSVYKPKTSKAFDESYVQAYLRDALGKFKYLTTNVAEAVFVYPETPADKAPKEKAPKAEKAAQKTAAPKKLSEVEESVLSVLSDVTQEDITNKTFFNTTETIATAIKKTEKQVRISVSSLSKKGLVVTEPRDNDAVAVALSQAGFDRLFPAKEAA